MNPERFFSHVVHSGGFRSKQEARPAIEAVMVSLGDALSPAESERLADELPGWLAEPLRDRDAHQDSSFFAEVAAEEGVHPGFAREHASAILQAMMRELSPETVQMLERALPAEIAELARPRERGAPPTRQPPEHPRSSLASGRSGSQHPVSDSDPAHQHSVACSSDPHGDTKLSESRGSAQERSGKTLATGKPGSSRPVSEDG